MVWRWYGRLHERLVEALGEDLFGEQFALGSQFDPDQAFRLALEAIVEVA